MMEETTVTSFLPRTDGDGMESLDTPITRDVKSVINITTESLESLKISPPKPPPAERIISLIPRSTSLPLGVKPKSTDPAGEKKAKFVPYEPYKAAVRPIIPAKRKISNLSQPATPTQQHSVERWNNAPPMPKDSALQKDYDRVLKEKEELEKQLKINSKVNSELKRLLVASVGEDMEARVHFLTEDKVKLGDDIRQYVEKIAVDFEQKEKLSIESDIWRSKFLASSVVIEELTKWKTVLWSRNEDLQICINGLLDEMGRIQRNFRQTSTHLKALNKAFDPLGNSSRKSPETVVSDVVESSGDILRLAESLSKRLLGTYTQVRDEDVHLNAASTEKPSPAQLAAKEALNMHPAGSCLMSEMVSNVTAHHVAALARRSMNKSFFACCPHCTGQVHIV